MHGHMYSQILLCTHNLTTHAATYLTTQLAVNPTFTLILAMTPTLPLLSHSTVFGSVGITGGTPLLCGSLVGVRPTSNTATSACMNVM